MTDREHDVAPHCSLDGEALAERVAMIRKEILPLARRSEALSNGRAWEFDRTPEARQKLEHLVELERRCCRSGITFQLGHTTGGALRLEVHGIDPNAKIFGAIAGPTPKPSGEPRPFGGLAKAGGLGVGISFAVFCVLPWLAIALFGATVAGPLARLDHPVVLGAGALAAATLAWRLWLRPRGTAGAGADRATQW